MEITGTTGAGAVRGALEALLAHGRLTPSRAGTALELRATTITVESPTDTLVTREDFDPRLAAAEALHLIGGLEYGPRIRAITEHLGSRRWARDVPSFGVRLRDWMPALVWKLARDPETRQAHAPIWQTGDLGGGQADYLCATGLQFLIRGGDLELIVTWRSNDVWHGLPYNLFAFGQLQATVARALGVGRGPLTFQVGSLHMYERHIGRAFAAREAVFPVRPVDGVGVKTAGDAQRFWIDAARRASMLIRGSIHLDPTPSEAALLELLA